MISKRYEILKHVSAFISQRSRKIIKVKIPGQGSSECIRGIVHFLIVTGKISRGFYGIRRNSDEILESLNLPIDRRNERLSVSMILHATLH
ncbi:hypothetical protein DY000_02008466 [Brassica cretica]|uniref:Uncharacterized protein n=1 Tax=Brassica cretica TaxID=69181 RepID=A0ABQ7CAF0_BRACR|nr:hypothetical protein DY000_02008466 [Brassica cretica]